MSKLILEFGCSLCYLEDKGCGTTCVQELEIDLTPLFSSVPLLDKFYNCENNSFVVGKDFFKGKRIPDVYRYDLIYSNTKGKWELYEPQSNNIAGDWKKTIIDNNAYKKPIENGEEPKNILILLESPHDKEYHYPTKKAPYFAPLQPANGATGRNFRRYFIDILDYSGTSQKPFSSLGRQLNKKITYRICFVNPVPFQASLHYFHERPLGGDIAKELRDMVWKELFIQCQDDFIRRVELYEPFMILNACTKDLKEDVKKEINSSKITCIHKFNTGHPSSWHSGAKYRSCKPW